VLDCAQKFLHDLWVGGLGNWCRQEVELGRVRFDELGFLTKICEEVFAVLHEVIFEDAFIIILSEHRKLMFNIRHQLHLLLMLIKWH